MLHFVGEAGKVSMQSIEHVPFSLIGGEVSDQRSLGCVASKLLDAGGVILHIFARSLRRPQCFVGLSMISTLPCKPDR